MAALVGLDSIFKITGKPRDRITVFRLLIFAPSLVSGEAGDEESNLLVG
jgi:hypothetical protein